MSSFEDIVLAVAAFDILAKQRDLKDSGLIFTEELKANYIMTGLSSDC